MLQNSLSRKGRALVAITALGLPFALTACGSDDSSGGDDKVAVTLITKDSVNPFWVAMQEGAKKASTAEGVDLTVAAGAEDGDEEGQIQAIENAVAQGQDGILIAPNGPGVNPAIEKARDAGLYVIALDTPPDPPDTVDITFATDNFQAGELIGEWTAAALNGEKATIALLDLFNDKVVTVDYNRDQGFLTGMGIDTADALVNGDEASSGSYSAGDYQIVCNEPTNGNADDGRTAMENCLSKTDDINVVYTINEPAAVGAEAALKAAGIDSSKVLIVSVDGGCEGVGNVKSGVIDATSQQYPIKMAEEGVKAIKTIATGGDAPQTSEGLDFFNTGVALVTDQPMDGVESIDSAAGSEICWG